MNNKPVEKLKVLSIISIVIGALALVTSWMPFVNNASAVLAVVAFILGLIALIFNFKNKKILSLISIAIAIISFTIVLITQAAYESTINHAIDSASKATVSDTKSPSNDNSKKNILTVDYIDYDIKSVKNYAVNFQNNDWAGTSIKINSVKIYKLAHSYDYENGSDGKFPVNGFAQLDMTIAPTRDIAIYPSQGTGIFSNSEQRSATSSSSWDGNIAKDAKKSGTILIPISSLPSDSSLSSIRFKFDANYETDNYEDQNSNHNYDFMINLQK